jgi:PKD repeat protein
MALAVNPSDGSCWAGLPFGLSGQVVHLSSNGDELWQAPGNLPATSLSVDPADGSVWLASTTSVVHLSSTGEEEWRGTDFYTPQSVSVNSADDSCWVADTGDDQVVHLSSTGEELWRGEGFSHPSSVSVNPTDGSCWVADIGNYQVVHLSEVGEELWRGGDSIAPKCVAVDPQDGSCWVESGVIVHLSAAGEELARAEGFRYPGGVSSNSISVDPTSGACWVADTDNGQVVKLVVAAGPPIIAAFSASPTTGVVPLEVDFIDQSSGAPTSWWWNFGDGSTSTVQNPTHSYTSPGIYDVSLTVSSASTTDTEVKLGYIMASFVDIPVGFWAANEVMACVEANIVSGYPDGTYQPSNPVTRDQMAVYISRALAGGDGNVPEFSGTPTFPDVTEVSWALNYVEYAVDQSVVAGYDDGNYHPEYQVTRDQMAVYVARAMVAPSGEAGLADYTPSDPRNFPDVSDTFWSWKHIEYCVENGVVNGYEDGNYHPEVVVTRDQMAVYIARARGLMP